MLKQTKCKASRTVYKHNTLEEACDLGVFLPPSSFPFFPQFCVDCVLVRPKRKLLSPTKISSLFYPDQTGK